MLFNLPCEVKMVESHLTWMEETIPYLECSLLVRSATFEDHIRFLTRKNEDNYEAGVEAVTDEDYEEEYNEDNPKFCSIYSCRLNEAAKLAYILQFDEALSKLALLEKIYGKLQKCHVAAFKYAVDALIWSIKVYKNLKEAENDSNFAEGKELNFEVVEDPAVLQRRWKDLQGDDTSKAVFRYLWACLGGSLKIMDDFLLEVFRQVSALDPEYHIWYAEVYRKMRSIRRNNRRQECGRLNDPSDEEQQMCMEAYIRNPDIYLSIKDMGIMLKETLWGLEQEEWDKKESKYLQCKNYFEQALAIATKRNQKNWIRKIQVYLAEFLLFGRGTRLDQEEGKRLFDQCVEENPNDSTVLHKVAKLCHFGATRIAPANFRKYRNWDLAEEFYKHALIADSANYPCLKDYLKLLRCGRRDSDYKAYIHACDLAIMDMKRDYQVSDLKICRGCVIWIYNPFEKKNFKEEACESWLSVLITLPEFAEKLYANIREPPFFVRQGKYAKPLAASINIRDLIFTLKRMERGSSADEDKLYAIKTFIENIGSTGNANDDNNV